MSAPTRRPDRTGRSRPVARHRVLLTTAVFALALVGLGTLTEALRHPLPGDGPIVPELDTGSADPRTPVECAEPAPREGQDRDEDTVTTPIAPAQVSSNALYDCPQTYAGATVRYSGEVVGAVLQRDDGAWIHLNDDVYGDALGPLPSHRDYRGGNAGVGVFVPLEVVDDIAFVGGPQARGDVVEVTGTFRRVDPASGEAAVIVADEAEVVRTGEPFVDPVLPDRRIVAFVVAALTVGVVVTERLVARRQRAAGARAR